MTEINITKADGTLAPYSQEKVLASLHRAKVPKDLQKEALSHLNPILHEGITTSEIYRSVFDFLRTHSKPAAAKYSLKSAIMEFGPSGYPFEKFIAKIFSALAFRTQTDVILDGECVSHEVDVIAEKAGEKLMIEAKFHNKPGIKTDVKTALYVHSRFQDLKEKYSFTQGGIVTNTRLTTDALQYAKCQSLRIISWDYPPGGSLPELIEQTKLHPITECVSLNGHERNQLMAEGIVLLSDALDMDIHEISSRTGINPKELDLIKKEAKEILNANHQHHN